MADATGDGSGLAIAVDAAGDKVGMADVCGDVMVEDWWLSSHDN